MHPTLLSCAAGLALAAAATAQCVAPTGTQTLTTTFDGTTYLGSVNATFGSNLFFDLTCNTTITIHALAVDLFDDGTVPTMPILTGQTADVSVWAITAPGSTYVGQHAVGVGGASAFPPAPPGWTWMSSGVATIAASDAPSTVVLASPITFAPGTYAMAINHLFVQAGQPNAGAAIHPLYTNPAIAPTSTVLGDQYVSLRLGSAQGQAWTGGLATPRIANVQLDYTLGANVAYSTPYGAGCYDRKRSFYESWAAPGSPVVGQLDIDPVGSAGAQNGFDMLNLGDSYFVTANSAPGLVVTPGSSARAVRLNAQEPALSGSTAQPWDDALAAPITLPFRFAYPGSATGTNVISVSSNGIVYFATGTSTFGFYDDYAGFVGNQPGIAAAWCDFDPADLRTLLGGQGDIWYDSDGSTYVAITWSNCRIWSEPANLSTVQLVLLPGGGAQVRYGASGVRFGDVPVLVGFTSGNAATDPGSGATPRRFPDLSIASTGGGFVSGDGAIAARVRIAGRPRVGAPFTIQTTNCEPSVLLNITLVSSASLPGIDLSVVGMTGCAAHVALPEIAAFASPLVAGATSWPALASIPAAFAGVDLFVQSLQLASGSPVSFNPANLLVSDALCVHFDVN